MDKEILIDLLVKGDNIKIIAHNRKLTEDNVENTLNKYNVKECNKGLLKDIFEENIKNIDKNRKSILIGLLVKDEVINILNKYNGKDYNKIKGLLEDIFEKNISNKYNIKDYEKNLLKNAFENNIKDIVKNINSIICGQSNNIIVHYRVLKLFLVYGYSKRGICRVINEIQDASGSKSQKITDRYNLLDKYRGCLFLHTKEGYERIIRNILVSKYIDEETLKVNFDRFAKKYEGVYILLKEGTDLENVHNVLNGELRNLIQGVFKNLKRDIGICQFKGCECKTKIENAHSGKSRPDIFRECIQELDDKNNINVEKLIKLFLEKHRNHSSRRDKLPPILYLCYRHHLQYDELSKNQKSDEYRNFVENLMI